MKEHITIIGAGNLTMSILEAIRRSRAKFTINVVDIDKKKSSQLKKFGVKLNTTYDDKISKSKLILLIVKPKDYVQALKSIDPYVNSQTIILSFIAGISVNQIEKLLTADVNIVRCMTNLAISERQSYMFYFMKKGSKKVVDKINKFLLTFSATKKCSEENHINKLTALYGSGPAYYIFFNSIIKKSFEQMGFNKKESDNYTHSLMLDSSELLGISDSQYLLRAIASKGGTTEAALSQLKKDKVDLSVRRAVQQAYKKSKKILSK